MKDILELLYVTLRGMWHRRWIGLLAAWIVGVIGVAVAFQIPQRHEASARVYVDTDTLLRPLLQGLAIQPRLDQQVALISRTLISRPNVEKLVRQADLDLSVRTPAQREELIDTVTKNIKLDAVRGNLYTISYRDPSPERARRVVQALLNIFVESSLGSKQKDTQQAFNFVDDQLKRYEDSLRASEARLKDFKLKYMGINMRARGDYFQRMSEVQGQIDAARLEVAANEQMRDSYKKQLAGETPTLLPEQAPPATEAPTTEFDTRIAALRKELDDLSRRFTDSHPDVIATRKRLDELVQQRQAMLDSRKTNPTARALVPLDRNPVYEQMRLSLAAAEASVAASRAKLAGYENQYNELKSQAKLVPQVEQEFAELNRDYDVQKKMYEGLLARRDAANMGKEVQDTGGAQFRVIDPPRVAPDPVPPTRTTLLAVAFAMALIAGFVAAFLASQLRPTFHSATALREFARRPFLGIISVVPDPRIVRQRRLRTAMFAGSTAALLLSMSAVMALVLLGKAV